MCNSISRSSSFIAQQPIQRVNTVNKIQTASPDTETVATRPTRSSSVPEKSPESFVTQTTKNLSRSVEAVAVSGGIKNPQLQVLEDISKGMRNLSPESSTAKKEYFTETKKLASDVGGLLSKANNDFNISGGTLSMVKDAFKGEDGKNKLSNVVRGTTSLSAKAQSGINNLIESGFEAINSGVEKSFKTLDETFTPKKTLSDAMGKYTEAKQTDSTKAKFKAAMGVGLAGIQAFGSAVTKNVAKAVIGAGAFVSGTAVAAAGLGARAVTAVVTPVAGALEAVGRTVLAPVAVAVGNTIGKVVVGSAVAVGGGLGIVAKATGVASVTGYIGNKIGNAAEYISDKVHTNKGKESMKEIDSMLSKAGFDKGTIDTKTQDVRKERGQDFETLGFKGTAKKWVSILRNRSEVTVGDALMGKNLINDRTLSKVTDGIGHGKRAISAANQLVKQADNLAGLSKVASTAAAVTGVAGVVGGINSITKSSYDIHKSRMMNERVDAFKDPEKLATRLEKKATALEKEATEAAKDGIIFGPDLEKAKSLNDRAASLRSDAAKIKEMGVDPEMANIAKQVGSRHGMGLSSVKLINGGVSIAGGAISSVNTIAVLAAGTALVANPAAPIMVAGGIAVG
ncbi:hypothetical protein EON78_02345, partial [bacterium]